MKSSPTLMVATRNDHNYLQSGDTVRFFIINASTPLWVQTPLALYPLLSDEEVTIVLPDREGAFPITFYSGGETIRYAYYISC